MKKIVLALTMLAFAVAVQAGEGKTCSKAQAGIAGADKATCASKAEAGCCAKATTTAQATCPSKSMSGCSAKAGLVAANTTCPKAQAAKKRSLMSPKAAGELAAIN